MLHVEQWLESLTPYLDGVHLLFVFAQVWRSQQTGPDIPAQSWGECREAPAGLRETAGEASGLVKL